MFTGPSVATGKGNFIFEDRTLQTGILIMSRRSSQALGGSHDVELESKVRKTASKVCENLHIIANEPSLAFYRLQEHTRKSMPVLIDKKIGYRQVHQNLQGRCYDSEYAINAVKSIERSKPHLKSILECLKNAMFMKQQLAYEEARRSEKRPTSMYHRSSASFDFPSFIPNTLNTISSAAGRLASTPTTISHIQRMRNASVTTMNRRAPSSLTQTMSIPHLAGPSGSTLNAQCDAEVLRSSSLRENRHSTHGVP